MNLDLSEALQTDIAETRGLLQDMEESLLHLEAEPEVAEAINAVFRAARTIKGSSGLFGLGDIVASTRCAGEVALNEGLIGLLLASCDHIASLIDLAATEAEKAAMGQTGHESCSH